MYGRFNPRFTSADYDNDGDIDFLVGDNSGIVEFYRNDGDCNFSSDSVINDFGCKSWGLTSCDIDNDGDIDVIIAAEMEQKNSVLGRFYLIQNNGSSNCFMTSGNKIIANITKYYGTASILTFDFDKDGNLEIFAGIRDTINIFNKVNGVYKQEIICKIPASNEGYLEDLSKGGLAVGDFNGDNYSDIVIGGSQGIIRLFINRGGE